MLNLVAHLLQLIPLYGPTDGEGDDDFHSGISRDFQPSDKTPPEGCVENYDSTIIINRCIGFDLQFVRITKPPVCCIPGILDKVCTKRFLRPVSSSGVWLLGISMALRIRNIVLRRKPLVTSMSLSPFPMARKTPREPAGPQQTLQISLSWREGAAYFMTRRQSRQS